MLPVHHAGFPFPSRSCTNAREVAIESCPQPVASQLRFGKGAGRTWQPMNDRGQGAASQLGAAMHAWLVLSRCCLGAVWVLSGCFRTMRLHACAFTAIGVYRTPASGRLHLLTLDVGGYRECTGRSMAVARM